MANKDASPFLRCFVVAVVVVEVFIVILVVVVIVCCDNESSIFTLVPYSSIGIGKLLNFDQFDECDLEGQSDGRMDGPTDKPTYRDASKYLKSRSRPFPLVNISLEPNFS